LSGRIRQAAIRPQPKQNSIGRRFCKASAWSRATNASDHRRIAASPAYDGRNRGERSAQDTTIVPRNVLSVFGFPAIVSGSKTGGGRKEGNAKFVAQALPTVQ
jgi:hypothetical protein